MTNQEWNIQKIITWMTSHFAGKKITSPRLDAELLLAHVLKCKRLDLYLKFDRPLGEAELKTLRELIVRRARREPVAYIIGNQEFYGRNFSVGSGVLIPRPETEHLVDEAIRWINHYDVVNAPGSELTLELFKAEPYNSEIDNPEINTSKIEASDIAVGAELKMSGGSNAVAVTPSSSAALSPQTFSLNSLPSTMPTPTPEIEPLPEIHILDVGSGSGCIGITLAAEFRQARVVSIDKSATGHKFTQENALALNVGERVTALHQSFEDFHPDTLFDLIVTNPPYVASPLRDTLEPEVRQFEPAEALFGGPLGHETIEAWLPKLSALLKEGGLLLCEIGYDQGAIAAQLTKGQSQFRNIEILKDYSGHQRILKAIRQQFKGVEHHG